MSASSTRRWIQAALLVCALTPLVAGVAGAQQGEQTWAYKLPYELMSPYCPGRTLAQCTSPQAGELRQWILMQEAAGATEAEVRANLLSRFGDAIRSTPKAEGWGLSAYVLPAVFFLGGGGLVVLLLKRMVSATRKPGAQPLAAAPPPSPGTPQEEAELARMVDEELGLAR
jgi:cytochrome c-type biogenesis protein CcmH/NrfF